MWRAPAGEETILGLVLLVSLAHIPSTFCTDCGPPPEPPKDFVPEYEISFTGYSTGTSPGDYAVYFCKVMGFIWVPEGKVANDVTVYRKKVGVNKCQENGKWSKGRCLPGNPTTIGKAYLSSNVDSTVVKPELVLQDNDRSVVTRSEWEPWVVVDIRVGGRARSSVYWIFYVDIRIHWSMRERAYHNLEVSILPKFDPSYPSFLDAMKCTFQKGKDEFQRRYDCTTNPMNRRVAGRFVVVRKVGINDYISMQFISVLTTQMGIDFAEWSVKCNYKAGGSNIWKSTVKKTSYDCMAKAILGEIYDPSTCTDSPAIDYIEKMYCDCPPDFTGFFCETKLDKNPVKASRVDIIGSPFGNYVHQSIGGDTGMLKESEPLQLDCSASGGQPDVYRYSWKFKPLYGGEERVIDGSKILLPKAMYTDSGWYLCEAVNDGGTASNSRAVYVQFVPKLKNIQPKVFANLNDEVTLSAVYTAYPSVTFHNWVQPPPDLANSRESSLQKGTNTFLAHLNGTVTKRENFGIYKFIVGNSLGGTQITIELSEKDVKPVKASRVDIIGDTKTLKESEPLQLDCSASGGQPDVYQYSWKFKPTYGGKERVIDGHGSNILLPKVLYTNSGWYICEAVNDGGTARNSRVVYVQFVPKLKSNQPKVFAKLNEEVTLSAEYTTYPSMTFHNWVQPPPGLANSRESSVEKGTNTFLAHLNGTVTKRENFGIYNFIVGNSLGESNIKIELLEANRTEVLLPKENSLPESKPDVQPPTQNPDFPPPAQSKVTAKSMLITWSPGPDADGPFTVVYRVAGAEEWQVYKEGVVRGSDGLVSEDFSGLQPDTEYEVRVQGQTGATPKITAKTRSLPPTPAALNFTLVGSYVEITWGKIEGDYDWAALKFCVSDSSDEKNCKTKKLKKDATRVGMHIVYEEMYIFTLELYQEEQLMATSEEYEYVPKSEANALHAANIGADPGGNKFNMSTISGIVAAIGLVAAVAVISLFVVKRRQQKKREDTARLTENRRGGGSVSSSSSSSDSGSTSVSDM